MILSIGDYAALSGLMLAVTGGNYLISDALNSATETSISSQIEVLEVEIGSDFDRMEEKFDALRADVVGTIEAGMEARGDELLLAFSKMRENVAGFTVRLANIEPESAIYSQFADLAREPGSTASLYRLGNSALASIYITDTSDPKALRLQQLIEKAAEQEDSDLRVEFTFGSEALASDGEFRARLLERQLRDLQEQIQELKSE